MSNLSQFIGGGSSPTVITGLPIETGETLAIGDFVGVDANEKLVKLQSAIIRNWSVGTGTNLNSFMVAEDLCVIFEGAVSSSKVYVYNGATNTLSAAVTLTSSATAGTAFDAIQLNNGNIVVSYGDASNVFFVTLTSAGVLVSNSVAKIAYTAFNGSLPTNSCLHKGFGTGDFFVVYQNTSATVTTTLFNSSYTQVGTVTTTTTAGVFLTGGEFANGWQIIRGTTNLCIFIGYGTTGYFGYYKIINGTTCAAIGTEGYITTNIASGIVPICAYAASGTIFYVGGIRVADGYLYYAGINETTGALTVPASQTAAITAGMSPPPKLVSPNTLAMVTHVQQSCAINVTNGWLSYNITNTDNSLLGGVTAEGRLYAKYGNGLGRATPSVLIGYDSTAYSGAFQSNSSRGAMQPIRLNFNIADATADLIPAFEFTAFTNPQVAPPLYGGLSSIRVITRSGNTMIINTRRVATIIGRVTAVAGTTASVDVSQMPSTLDSYNGAAYEYRGKGAVTINGVFTAIGG